MDADPINDLAAVIRQYPNDVDANTLGAAIALQIDQRVGGTGGCDCEGCADVVAGIIRRVNPDRTMGAARLAEAIWNDLNEG